MIFGFFFQIDFIFAVLRLPPIENNFEQVQNLNQPTSG